MKAFRLASGIVFLVLVIAAITAAFAPLSWPLGDERLAETVPQPVEDSLGVIAESFLAVQYYSSGSAVDARNGLLLLDDLCRSRGVNAAVYTRGGQLIHATRGMRTEAITPDTLRSPYRSIASGRLRIIYPLPKDGRYRIYFRGVTHAPEFIVFDAPVDGARMVLVRRVLFITIALIAAVGVFVVLRWDERGRFRHVFHKEQNIL